MVFLFIILLPLLSGWIIINGLNTGLNTPIKIGASYNLGIGLISFSGFFCNLIGMKFGLLGLVLPIIIACGILLGLNFKEIKTKFVPQLKLLKSEYQLYAWWLLLALILYLLYGAYMRALYWPITEYDSVCGYDYVAKYLVAEHSFDNTLLRSKDFLTGNRYLYPAFVASADAYGYLVGLKNAHLITWLQYASFLLAFYGLVRHVAHPVIAILATFMMSVTPDFFAHASFSLTNIPNAIFSSLGMIALVMYFAKPERGLLLFAALFIGLGLWCRVDAIVYYILSFFMLALFAFMHKKYMDLMLFALIGIIPYAAWNIFTTQVLHVSASAGFIDHLGIDTEKISVIGAYVYDLVILPNQQYALTFCVFWIVLMANIQFILDEFFNVVTFFLFGLVMYAGLFYFIDNAKTGVSTKVYMEMALKRGLFTLVPLAWYFFANNPLMIKLQEKVDFLRQRD